ncbi:S8 family serine peptidase [Salipiger sp. P9]|uniref:S8 family serine peptidase n=1 Tax=Salipiger pentaromativorans TaxID=2943193 RepID=UPI002157DA62|nr:S8 family serine peptidase [Salipiger pentaromativorans]MCR8547433.1 S8 family serine peptidase [Salipiger pentaromativorans]
MAIRFRVTKALIERLLYGSSGGTRFTQDTPVLLDVWQGYAEAPGAPQDVLITPHFRHTAHDTANHLFDAIALFRAGLPGGGPEHGTDLADVPGIVVGRLDLRELVNVLLPDTNWWRRNGMQALITEMTEKDLTALAAEKAEILIRHSRTGGDGVSPSLAHSLKTGTDDEPEIRIPETTWRLLIAIGLISASSADANAALWTELKDIDPARVRRGLEQLLRMTFLRQRHEMTESDDDTDAATPYVLRSRYHMVSRNRCANASVADGVPTIKADAARRLFQTDCSDLTWAVIDSGIDASHYAFRRGTYDDKEMAPDYYDAIADPEDTRIRRIYDFTYFRELISRDQLALFGDADAREAFIARHNLDTRLDECVMHRSPPGRRRETLAQALNAKRKKRQQERHAEIRGALERMYENHAARRPFDWTLVEALIRLDFTQSPVSQHGTHVAGILGAGPLTEDGTDSGVCPDIKIYDFRVLADTVENSEFAIIGALRFIRHLNDTHDFVRVHGVNMSLSLEHDVRNFACGGTPVCTEADRLVGDGIVVVAAAGNLGYNHVSGHAGAVPTFTFSTITDPGNAASVITVGSTHRREPHAYGVSYFSSRGPTGDGRLKPDLVAPGEKIKSAVLRGETGVLDGTSMAAPHVSGAAALLMARFPELIGEAPRIKRILCDSATDLGRERYFQGAGLLDVLRAMQSV